MASFYSLPSTVIGNEKYKTLKAAYCYYNVATTVPLTKLIGDLLIFAKKVCFPFIFFSEVLTFLVFFLLKQLDYDVVNCLNLMENETFLKDLKFGQGDGNLQYYLYNWRCPEMNSSDVGLVLL